VLELACGPGVWTGHLLRHASEVTAVDASPRCSLFTSGPTRDAADGRWHLFAYQIDATQRTKVDPGDNGPTPPEPPPLRGYSPRTAAGIGFGSTLA
jgi:hypothetical protein